MDEGFDVFLPEDVMNICRILHNSGRDCYLVGGPVRDMLRGKTPVDFDMATDALPNEIEDIFQKAGYHTVPTGKEFGTITVLGKSKAPRSDVDDLSDKSEMKGLREFEITTYRGKEVYKYGDRKPEVVFATDIQDDLSRRDFTINSMAYDPIDKTFIDIFDGREDLRYGLIKAVGDAGERFREDPLRMMRACRFLSKMGPSFRVDKNTATAIKVMAGDLKHVSLERIRDEMEKTLMSTVPSTGIKAMHRFGLLSLFLPELAACRRVKQNPKYHVFDVFDHILSVVDTLAILGEREATLGVRWAGLMHDIGKAVTFQNAVGKDGDIHGVEPPKDAFYGHEEESAKATRVILQRLKEPNRLIRFVTKLVSLHMDLPKLQQWMEGDKKAKIRRYIDNNIEYLKPLSMLSLADRMSSKNGLDEPHTTELEITNFWQDFLSIQKPSQLSITGDDILRIFSGNGDMPPEEFVAWKKDNPGEMRNLHKEYGKVVGALLSKYKDILYQDPSRNTRDSMMSLLKRDYMTKLIGKDLGHLLPKLREAGLLQKEELGRFKNLVLSSDSPQAGIELMENKIAELKALGMR